MKVIGITGQTGAGKSTVCKMLADTGRYFHIDADKVAREVTGTNRDVLKALAGAFGHNVLFSDGSLNRKSLAKQAFANEKNTDLLNSITHSAITEQIRKIILQNEMRGEENTIIDAIALFESGEDSLCDFTASVIAPPDIRLDRIIKRDNLTRDEALLRINAQKSEYYYTKKADIIIYNFPPHDLNDEVLKIVDYE